MPTATQPPIAEPAATESAEVVTHFIETFGDVIDRMQAHSGGVLDQGLLAELRDTIEDQACGALAAYEKCCWLEADPTAVVRP